MLDPFAGSGSTLAAANAVGYRSIGVEQSDDFIEIARGAIPQLSALTLVNPSGTKLRDARPVQRRRPSSKLAALIPAEVGRFDFS